MKMLLLTVWGFTVFFAGHAYAQRSLVYVPSSVSVPSFSFSDVNEGYVLNKHVSVKAIFGASSEDFSSDQDAGHTDIRLSSPHGFMPEDRFNPYIGANISFKF